VFNVPNLSLSLAGFQLITIGRFWVITEGRPHGRGFGLSVQVVTDPIAANLRVSSGSYGWDGAFGTHFWIDPKEDMVSILMMQTPNMEILRDFDNAIMQAIIE
jgi:CubicO group peptidase (beta-lactamase class C family)